jgi:phospholipase/carboxylesterase
VAAVDEFVAHARERYPVDPRKVVMLGFSQGGVLAYIAALGAPARFAGLAALSSWLPPALVAGLAPDAGRGELPVLVQHGSADEIIAVARAHGSVETLRELGAHPTYREYPMGHEISAASLGDLSRWLEETVLAPRR